MTDISDDLLAALSEFYSMYYPRDIEELKNNYSYTNCSIEIDAEDLDDYRPEFSEALRESPEYGIQCLEEGLKEYDPFFGQQDDPQPRVRIKNLPWTTKIGELNPNHRNTLEPVEAIVDKVAEPTNEIHDSVFNCTRCNARIPLDQDLDDFREPHECPKCERNGPFELVMDECDFRLYQKVRLKQVPEETDSGNDGEKLIAHVRDDLVGQLSAGDRLVANSIVRVKQKDPDSKKFDAYLDINSINLETTDLSSMEISREDEERIMDLAQSDNIVEKIRDSVAPRIEGYNHIKEAIALQLVGGVSAKLGDDPDSERVRGEIHTLVIGDPGKGKSVMLKSASRLHPRSVLTSGEGSTGTGLTAAAVRDDFGEGQWSVETGALPVADQGIACVDELDKMSPEDRQKMNTVLASGEVPVSKAGINTEIKARTSLFSAANPEYGRFDPYEPVADQINLESPLLSRLDLIFTLTDDADPDDDRDVVDHMMETNHVATLRKRGTNIPDKYQDQVNPEVEIDLLRKYIVYASKNVVPILHPESEPAKELRKFFLKVRQEFESEDTVPITLRKFKALQRLAQASARLRLSDEVELEDVERTIGLVEKSMSDVMYDPETGELDADLVETEHSSSQRQRIKTLLEIIDGLMDARDDGLAPHEEVLDNAEEIGLGRENAEKELETMQRNGDILEAKNGAYRVVE